MTGQHGLAIHPVVKGLLAAFERAESALKKEDLDALMQFYAPAYDYHGLKGSDVRRIWSEVFEHYNSVESLHLFSDIKVTQVNNEITVLPVSQFDDELRFRIARAIYSNSAFSNYAAMANPPARGDGSWNCATTARICTFLKIVRSATFSFGPRSTLRGAFP